jgi:hypothetical protein
MFSYQRRDKSGVTKMTADVPPHIMLSISDELPVYLEGDPVSMHKPLDEKLSKH